MISIGFFVLSLTIHVLASGISEDYAAKDETRPNEPAFESSKQFTDNQIVEPKGTRRVFDWITTLFNVDKEKTEVTTQKPFNISLYLRNDERQVDELLQAVNHIASSLDKLNSNVELHIMLSEDEDDRLRSKAQRSKDEETVTSVISNNETKSIDERLVYSVNRIANALEKISSDLQLHLHMLVSGKNKFPSKYHAKKYTRKFFEWINDVVVSGKKQPQFTERSQTDYNVQLSDKGKPTDMLEAVERVGTALDGINSNVELQLHVLLDCKCKDGIRKKRHTLSDGQIDAHINDVEFNNILDSKSDSINSFARAKRQVGNDTLNVNETETKMTAAPEDGVIPAPNEQNASTTTVLPIVEIPNVSEINEKLSVIKQNDSLLTRRQDGSEVKSKLINYIYEAHNDIINKMFPLLKVKEQLIHDDLYKIGYIMANIDTLEVNVKNLKKDVDANKETWNEKRIMEVLDSYMASSRILSSLIDSLKTYQSKPVDVENNNVISGLPAGN